MTTRREFLAYLAACGSLPMLSACQLTQLPALRLALHTWPGYEFVFYAQREGLLDSRQVVLQETRSASETFTLLQQGQVDAAALTLDEVLRQRSLGQELVVVMVFNISAGADMVLSKEPIDDLSALRGKRIAVEYGAVGALMFHKLLQRAGLNEQDVFLQRLSIDQHLAAWQRDEIDLSVCYSPVADHLLALEAHTVFDSRSLPNLIVDVLAVRRSVLGLQAHALRHLIKAHFLALNKLQQNPQDTSYRMAQHLRLPAEAVLQAFRGIELCNVYRNRQLLAGSPAVLQASANELQRLMLAENLLPKPALLQGWIRADYLPTS